MALKPTIYKFNVALSDLDRNRYEELALTVAQHPSETVERMMVRLLAYCMNVDEGLEFTRGLSENDEPDLWRRSLDGRLLDWIEVGEPAADRLRKASHLSERVLVYSFNTKSDVWWRQVGSAVVDLSVVVFQFPWESIEQLAGMVERTMQMSVTISDSSLFVAVEHGEVELTPVMLSE